MADKVARVTKTYKCGYCCKFFPQLVDPRRIPCLHVFCLPCLKINLMQRQTNVRCSYCRMVHNITDVTSLPRSNLNDPLEEEVVVEVEVETDVIYCNLCEGTPTKAVTFCVESQKKLCEQHAQEHQQQQQRFMGVQHEFVPIKQYMQAPYRYVSDKCKSHPDHPVKEACSICYARFCVRCVHTKVVCRDDKEQVYSHHDIDSLHDVSEELRRSLNKKSESLAAKIAKVVEIEKDAWNKLDDIQYKAEQIMLKIDRLTKEKISAIRAESDKFKKEIEELVRESVQKVEEFAVPVLDKWYEMQSLWNSTQKMINNSTDSDIVEMYRNKIDELNSGEDISMIGHYTFIPKSLLPTSSDEESWNVESSEAEPPATRIATMAVTNVATAIERLGHVLKLHIDGSDKNSWNIEPSESEPPVTMTATERLEHEHMLHFDDNTQKLVDANGEGFQFDLYGSDHSKNQRRYEAIGELMTGIVYELLEQKLDKVHLHPKKPGGGFIFCSRGYEDREKLLVLIHDSGVVRAGQWSRRLIINDSLNSGTQLPYIRRAMLNGWGVLVMNTNDRRNEEGSRSPSEHGEFVWKKFIKKKSNIKKIAIVAHGAGGGVTADMLREYEQDFKTRVFAIAFTDAFGSACGSARQYFSQVCTNWVTSHQLIGSFVSRGSDMTCVSAGTMKHEETSHYVIDEVFKFIEARINDTKPGSGDGDVNPYSSASHHDQGRDGYDWQDDEKWKERVMSGFEKLEARFRSILGDDSQIEREVNTSGDRKRGSAGIDNSSK